MNTVSLEDIRSIQQIDLIVRRVVRHNEDVVGMKSAHLAVSPTMISCALQSRYNMPGFVLIV